MPKPLMSDAELRRRKKVQARLSQVTGGLGLAALGGTLVASRGGRNTMRRIPQVKPHIKKPPKRDPDRDRIKGGITPVLATSAGLGGLGSFNFAAYTAAESKKRKAMTAPKKKPVVKSADELAPVYGEVAKAWTATAKPYDPEAKRAKRAKVYEAGLGAAGGAALGGAAVTAGQAGVARNKVVASRKARMKDLTSDYKPPRPKNAPHGPLTRGQASWQKGKATQHARKKAAQQLSRDAKLKGTEKAQHKIAVKNIKTSGKLAAVGAAGIGASEYVRRRKHSDSWAPYAKRDSMSAFGVDHTADTDWTAP